MEDDPRRRPRAFAAPGVLGGLAAAAAATDEARAQAALAPPAPGVIADGVSIGGVPVAGLDRRAARARVLTALVAARRRPIEFRIGGRTVRVNPAIAGYVARVTTR
ncbi:hypothetical protein [Miltoncostaea marina]|uniref:hypothetical protein n=1 Tax=Miltoncostaea marina TaxID=2843215 RepID=UPI001C3DE59F|nr:hypothetical protein [Miltoncostaea marina]